jgi:putative ABC transport system ATP-binding protein
MDTKIAINHILILTLIKTLVNNGVYVMSEKINTYSLENVSKVIDDGGQRSILNNISLNISEGEFLGLRGKSGAGKSTLLNILGCIDNISSGKIYFEGKDISRYTKKEKILFIRKIGLIFQHFYLIEHFNVFENIALPLRLCGERKAEIEKKVNLSLENVGLEPDKLRQLPKTLSGGEKQRVAIARAIVKSPKVILADEPTGSLDSENESIILDLLQKIHSDRQGVTVILVSHNPNVIEICSKVIELADGEIVQPFPNFADGGIVESIQK